MEPGILLENLTVSQRVWKYSAFYGTLTFTAVLKKSRPWTLS